MKTSLGISLLLSSLPCTSLWADTATIPQPKASIISTPNGKSASLTLSATPGGSYRVQRADDLASDWETLDLIRATGTEITWTDLTRPDTKKFYRFILPYPEVFQVYTTPEVVAGPTGMNFGTGTNIFLEAQCLPVGAVVVLSSPGLTTVSLPLISTSDGIWQALAPSLADGVYDVEVQDNTGKRVFVIPHVLEKSSSRISDYGPPESPPMLVNLPNFLDLDADNDGIPEMSESIGNVDEDCDDKEVYRDDASLRSGLPPSVPRLGGGTAVSLSGSDGKVVACDLAVSGAGMDFAWKRTYRPRGGPGAGSPMGTGWDHCYNVRCVRASDGSTIDVAEGGGRPVRYYRGSDGTYTAAGYFRQGVVVDGPTGFVFTLTFSDKTRWEFFPMGGAITSGKLQRCVDKDGNTTTLNYDGNGRLSSLVDTLNHTITVAYGTNGKISSVTNHAGQSATFAYYVATDAGGGAGDLKSVTLPGITGSPLGNNYPAGFTTTYTYSKGFADDRLNHNLLTATNSLGQTVMSVSYAPTQDPTALEFDRPVRVSYGPDGASDFHFGIVSPTVDNGFAYMQSTCRRADGSVCVMLYDSKCRCTQSWEFSSFSASPPTSLGGVIVLPINDPPLVTRCSYNANSCCISCRLPSGTGFETLFQSDLDPNCPVREQGNLRIHRCVAAVSSTGGRTTESTVERFSTLPGFGLCEPGGCCAAVANGMLYSWGSSSIIGGWMSKKGYDYYMAQSDLNAFSIFDEDDDCDSLFDLVIDECSSWSWGMSQSGSSRSGLMPTCSDGTCSVDSWSWGESNPSLAFDHAVKSPRDSASGLATGRRLHYPLILQNDVITARDAGSGMSTGRRQYSPLVYRRDSASGLSTGRRDHASGRPTGRREHGSGMASGKRAHASGLPTGRRMHKPMTITKELDKSTPLLSKRSSITSPRDAASGLPTGKRMHKPFVITKELDKSTPLLLRGIGTFSDGNKRVASFLECFCTQYVSSRGAVWTATFSATGSCTSVQGPISGQLDTFEYDNKGRMTAHVCPADAQGHARRDTCVFNTDTLSPSFGYCTSVTRDAASGQATGLRITTSFEYDLAGYCVRVIDPLGRPTTYAVGGLGLITEVGFPALDAASKDSCYLYYNGAGQLVRCDVENKGGTGVLDATNPQYSCFIKRDVLGRATEVAEEIGGFTAASTGAPTLELPFAEQSKFSRCAIFRDAAGNESQVRGPRAVAGNQLDQTCDFIFDGRGNCVEVSRGAGGPSHSRKQFHYDGDGCLIDCGYIQETDYIADCVLSYDGLDQLSSVTCPADGTTCVFVRDAEGNLSSLTITGPTGHTGSTGLPEIKTLQHAVCSYDLSNRPTLRTSFGVLLGSSGGCSSIFTYAPNSAITSVRSGDTADDTEVASIYDSAGRLQQTLIRSVGSPAAKTVYACFKDAAGNISSSSRTDHIDGTAPKTYTVSYAYNRRNQLVSCTDGKGNTQSFTSDSLDRLLSHTDALGSVTRTSYGSTVLAGSPVGSGTILLEADLDGDGAFETLRTCTCTPGYHVNSISSRAKQGSSGRTKRCEMARTVDARGNVTTCTVDAFDRPILVTEADGRSSTFFYNHRGQEIASIDPAGNTSTCVHNMRGQLISCTVTPAVGMDPNTVAETFVNDGLSRCVKGQDSDSVVECFYDGKGNRIQEIQNGHSFSYTFDRRNRLTHMTNPNGSVIVYGYDATGLCTSVGSLNAATGAITNLATYTYEGERVRTCSRSDGTTDSFTYSGFTNGPAAGATFDELTRVTTTKGSTVLSDWGQLFDANQRHFRRSHFRSPTSTRREDFSRDVLGRVIHALTVTDNVVEIDEVFTLDLQGNRVSVTGGNHPGAYTMSAVLPNPGDSQMNQYTTTPRGACTYFDNGCLRSNGTVDFTYDARRRLTKVSDTISRKAIASYGYDVFGNRISKTLHTPTGDQNRLYLFGGMGIAEIKDGTGSTLVSRVSGAAGSVCITPIIGDTFYPHFTGSDSNSPACAAQPISGIDISAKKNPGGVKCTLATNSNGDVLEKYSFDQAGTPTIYNPTGAPIANSAIDNIWLDDTTVFDEETSLFSEGGRSYESTTMRWSIEIRVDRIEMK